MVKADMRKGMLLKGKIGAEERIYRVLDLKEKVLVLDCVKKTMPVWKTYEELSDCVEKEEESMAEAIDIIDAMEGESRKTAYQRYNMISGILPFLSEENMRTEAIKRASERYGISKQTVRNYLCEYLATMDVRSLAPGYKKAEKKLSADEKNMRKSLNKWYYTTKKRTLKNCYTLMLQHFYCNADGNLTEEAKAAIEILEQYAKTFQERNPNLYLFNCVMHLDEATPHLHIDYIPVANGYKTGMKTRNSLTKALQQMGFAKAVSKKENETVAWQQRERAYLTELCQEKGIDVEVLGVQRDNLTLPEYKAAMQKVEKLEHQEVKIEENNQRLAEQAEKLADQIAKLDEKEKDNKEVLKKHDLRADTLKTIVKETEKDTKNLKSAAVPVSNIFGSEEYVKVKKSDW